MAAACIRKTVKAVHISSVIPGLVNDLSKRCPHVKFINVPVGCSGEVEKLQEAKVILADPDTAPRHLSKLPELEWLQLTWAGIDGVVERVTPQQKSSMMFTRFGGVFGPAMAQYVVGHIVSWEREFRKMWSDQQECKWDEEWRQIGKYRVMPKLTIGILGLGDIGQTIAKACRALGMTVWGVGRRDKSDRQDFVDHYTTLSRLPEVLQSCDYFVIYCQVHLPLNISYLEVHLRVVKTIALFLLTLVEGIL
ncbi:hypothetical protein OS493_001562 [Desmophyllum pertusum]|uniref:D-isomer specific 2-hydroxyacid dehydrogenase NAD-binding domain-containing protein n=1 Tax=Desmophyllum pertusum TaxID=174260 RepID=A0A9W9ZH34_9CNID|nr:hypothetical protein OS493_001562 [Desmophyllum pertusum]